MADEARLVVELVDRSPGGQTPTGGPTAASSGSIPGSTLASDFQQQITSGGLPAPGTGSATAAAATPLPTPVPSAVSTPAPTPTTPTGDPLLGAVQAIVTASPQTTSGELEAAFGIPGNRAQALLSAAQQQQQQTNAAAVPSPMPAPIAPAGQPAAAPTGGPSPQGLTDINSGAMGAGMERLRDQMDPWQRGLRNMPTDIEAEEPISEYDPKTAGKVHHAISTLGGIASRFGPGPSAIAGVVQTAASQFPEIGASLSALAPAAPYLAVGAAAVALPVAAVIASTNEAERALSITERYSPDVAQARAEANVRQIMADLRTSEILGDEAANYVENTSRLSTSTQGIRDRIVEPWLQDWNNLLNVVAQSAEAADKNGDLLGGFSALLKTGYDLYSNTYFIKKALAALADQGKKQDLGNPFFWFSSQAHLDPPAPFSNTAPTQVTTDDPRILTRDIGIVF